VAKAEKVLDVRNVFEDGSLERPYPVRDCRDVD
jgi:hypothetical protein